MLSNGRKDKQLDRQWGSGCHEGSVMKWLILFGNRMC